MVWYDMNQCDSIWYNLMQCDNIQCNTIQNNIARMITQCTFTRYTSMGYDKIPPGYKNPTDLVCSCLLQWGFHSLWTLADPKPCSTTHATSTWTRRRASQWVSGRSFEDSGFILWSPPVLENTTSMCIFWYRWLPSEWNDNPLINLHKTTGNTTRGRVFESTSVFVFQSPPSLSTFVSQAYTPCQPMGRGHGERPWVVPGNSGRRPPCYYLSPWQPGDQVGWERQHRDPWRDPNGFSGCHMTARAPGLLLRHNKHNAEMSPKATRLFVFTALVSFLQGHTSQSGTGEGAVAFSVLIPFDSPVWIKFWFLCVADFKCCRVSCPIFRLQRWVLIVAPHTVVFLLNNKQEHDWLITFSFKTRLSFFILYIWLVLTWFSMQDYPSQIPN